MAFKYLLQRIGHYLNPEQMRLWHPWRCPECGRLWQVVDEPKYCQLCYGKISHRDQFKPKD